MDIYFVTANKHKFGQAQRVLSKFITLHQLEDGKMEPKEWGIEKVAGYNAKKLADKTGKPVVVDDTGIFFDAYEDFPSHNAKWVIEKLGYEGIFKLLKGVSRKATFKCAVGFCRPGEQEKVFIGELQGEIGEEVKNKEKDTLPYNKIFKPNGYDKTLAEMDDDLMISLLHRTKAFEKLGAYLGEAT